MEQKKQKKKTLFGCFGVWFVSRDYDLISMSIPCKLCKLDIQ